MERILLKRFIHEIDPEISADLQELASEECDMISNHSMKLGEELQKKYSYYQEKVRQGHVGKTAQFWLIGDTSTSSTNNVADKARLDVSAVGVWSPMERTFFDERVVHPNSTKEKMSRRSIKKMRKKRRTSTINELYKLRRPRSPP